MSRISSVVVNLTGFYLSLKLDDIFDQSAKKKNDTLFNLQSNLNKKPSMTPYHINEISVLAKVETE